MGTQIKKLSFLKRPWGAKKIIEVGGGHAPYFGITHAVDKYPGDTDHRAHSYHLPQGVTFRQGDLENIPFDEKFDFLYASHVFEHVTDPVKAIAEINRLTSKGYIETPAPIWETLKGGKQFDPNDIHKLYVWRDGETLNAIAKTSETIGTFCNCERGNLAKTLIQIQDKENTSLEPFLTSKTRTTKLHFTAPIAFTLFKSFSDACRAGHCAFSSLDSLRQKLKLWPLTASSRRVRKLRSYLKPYLT